MRVAALLPVPLLAAAEGAGGPVPLRAALGGGRRSRPRRRPGLLTEREENWSGAGWGRDPLRGRRPRTRRLSPVSGQISGTSHLPVRRGRAPLFLAPLRRRCGRPSCRSWGGSDGAAVREGSGRWSGACRGVWSGLEENPSFPRRPLPRQMLSEALLVSVRRPASCPAVPGVLCLPAPRPFQAVLLHLVL